MIIRPQIYISDLLEVEERISPRGPETRAMLLRMLQLETVETADAQQEPEAISSSQEQTLGKSPPPSVPPPSPTPRGTAPINTRLVKLRQSTAPPAPVWLEEGSTLALEQALTPLHVPPLLEPRRSAALLSSALATLVEEGEVLIPELVKAFAHLSVLERLPRRRYPTLRRGVQVLVDRGEGMIPFDSDVRFVVERLQKVAGRTRAEILHFTGSPLRGAGRGPRETWKRWSLPAKGTPILLLTDLGLGGPAMSSNRAYAAEWSQVAEQAHHAGCPLVALVPHGPRHWPRALRRRLVLLHWDRTTTVNRIRSRIGRGHKVIRP